VEAVANFTSSDSSLLARQLIISCNQGLDPVTSTIEFCCTTAGTYANLEAFLYTYVLHPWSASFKSFTSMDCRSLLDMMH